MNNMKHFNKNDLIELNKRGIKRHPSYPRAVDLKIIDIFHIPGTDLERYTCSYEAYPNPKSKKGLYYVLNNEVEEFRVVEAENTDFNSERIYIDLKRIDFIENFDEVLNIHIEHLISKVNASIYELNNYNLDYSRINNYLEIITKYNNLFVALKAYEKEIREIRFKVDLLSYMITKFQEKIFKQSDYPYYKDLDRDFLKSDIMKILIENNLVWARLDEIKERVNEKDISLILDIMHELKGHDIIDCRLTDQEEYKLNYNYKVYYENRNKN